MQAAVIFALRTCPCRLLELGVQEPPLQSHWALQARIHLSVVPDWVCLLLALVTGSTE